jgi:phosphate:Na+ symporter
MIPGIMGGIGLFLLGMVLMTEGLKAAGGDALRRVLSRLTGGPAQAFLSGAGVTLAVQSSSATVLATIGFVSAGLLTFSQAIGVIFGAAVGTTSTGWIVSLIGLRLKISVFALPLVGIGALMRLLLHGRSASFGLALAGFGLIFVGIDTLQSGMEALAVRIDPAGFPVMTLFGSAILLGIGLLMTVVMQSSSAAVATTLTALHTGTIRIDQAAVLVIGQNMGTAVTAALASIGAAVPAKRTALAHVLFNSFAGIVAFALLPVFLWLVPRLSDRGDGGVGAATAIAGFHTGFNLIAVAILLPVTARFAGLVVRILPDRGPALTRHLDASVTQIAQVAVEAARRTTAEVAGVIFSAARTLLGGGRPDADYFERLVTAELALAETRRFLGSVRTSRAEKPEHARHLSVLHAVDHLDRMISALRDSQPLHVLPLRPRLRPLARDLARRLDEPLAWIGGGREDPPISEVREMSRAIAELRRTGRPEVMALTAAGEIEPDAALEELDVMRWIDRLSYHTWRAVEHLGGEAEPMAEEAAP